MNRNNRLEDSRVVLREGSEALMNCLEFLDVRSTVRGLKKALIKPNLRAAAVENYLLGSTTDVRLIEQLVDFLIAQGLEVSIGECTSSRSITQRALERCGILNLGGKARVLNLNDEKCVRLRTNDERLKYLDFPSPIVDADFLISMPVMKTHSVTRISLGLKNMMGSTGEFMPVRLHLKGLEASIACLNRTRRPDLTIIDATIAMEGTGPVLGTSLHLNTVLASYDPVAVDTIGSRMMGFPPESIGHIVGAEKIGVGTMKPEFVDGTLTVHHFRPSRHGLLVDLYAYKWFNMLMSLKPVHRYFYGAGYEKTKRILRLVSPIDREPRKSE